MRTIFCQARSIKNLFLVGVRATTSPSLHFFEVVPPHRLDRAVEENVFSNFWRPFLNVANETTFSQNLDNMRN
jgi:hypothetical protein